MKNAERSPYKALLRRGPHSKHLGLCGLHGPCCTSSRTPSERESSHVGHANTRAGRGPSTTLPTDALNFISFSWAIKYYLSFDLF